MKNEPKFCIGVQCLKSNIDTTVAVCDIHSSFPCRETPVLGNKAAKEIETCNKSNVNVQY